VSSLKESLVDYDPETGRMRRSPRQVFLELTSRCNLACVHCSKDFGSEAGHPQVDLPADVIDRLEPWLLDAEAVNLNGVGESLILPSFPSVLERVTKGPATVSFNTNGLPLTASLCDQIVRHRASSVVISVDGIESNEPIRGVPYEVVRKRIFALAEAKARAASRLPRVGIAYTLMRRNLHELPRLLEDVLPRARIDSVHVQPLIVFYETLVDENVYGHPDVGPVLDRSRQIADRSGTVFTVFRSSFGADERVHGVVEAQLGQTSERFGCIDPFFEIKIRSTGDVMSCSFGLTGGLNVRTSSLDEVWNHDWYRALRRRLYAKRFEGDCARCPYVFGSAAAQTSHLRAGVRHSHHERFAAAPPPTRARASSPPRDFPFRPTPFVPTRSVYSARSPRPGAIEAVRRNGASPRADLAILDAVVVAAERSAVPLERTLAPSGRFAEDVRDRLADLPYYERIHAPARARANDEWAALTRRAIGGGVPFWVDRPGYYADLVAGNGRAQLAAERILVEPGFRWVVERTRRHGGRVLVLACGFGALSLELARAGLEVVGVDDNPQAIEMAAALAALEPGLALRYGSQDFEGLTLPPSEFDVVCAWQTLHHQELSPRIAHQIWRALRPGGEAVLQDFLGEEGEHPLQTRAGSEPALARVRRWSSVATRLGFGEAPPVPPRASERRTQLAAMFPPLPGDDTPRAIAPVERVTGRELVEAMRARFARVDLHLERGFLDYGHIYPLIASCATSGIPSRHLAAYFRALLLQDRWLVLRKKTPPREYRLVARKPQGASDAAAAAAPEDVSAFDGIDPAARRRLTRWVEAYRALYPASREPIAETLAGLSEAGRLLGADPKDARASLERGIQEAYGRRRIGDGLRLGDRDRYALLAGFHNAAPSEGCRWFDGDGRLLFFLPSDATAVRLRCRRGFRRDEQEEGIPVTVLADDIELGTSALRFAPSDVEEARELEFPLTPRSRGLVELRIRARSFVPHDEVGNGDRRRLAFRIERVDASR